MKKKLHRCTPLAAWISESHCETNQKRAKAATKAKVRGRGAPKPAPTVFGPSHRKKEFPTADRLDLVHLRPCLDCPGVAHLQGTPSPRVVDVAPPRPAPFTRKQRRKRIRVGETEPGFEKGVS